MSKDYEIISLIVCEDVRQEANGKAIIFGLFDSEILVPSFPATIKLFFRVAVRFGSWVPKTAHFEVKGKSGTKLFEFNGPATMPPTVIPKNRITAMGFLAFPAFVPQEDTFTVKLGFDEKKPVKIGEVSVFLPRTAEERTRIAL